MRGASARMVGLLVVGLSLAGLALPATAGRATPQALAGTTYVDTTRSSTTLVRLPQDAHVALDPRSPGVTFRGPGRLLALWLERTDRSGDFLTSYRLPAFAGGTQLTYGSAPFTCTPAPSSTVPLTSECATDRPGEALLRAGTYRLKVLADGRPVRIALRLRGLGGGTTTVRPATTLPSEQRSLPVRETAGSAMVSFGDSADLRTGVDTFLLARATSVSGAGLRHATTCQRRDAGARPLSYGPHCPDGSSGSYEYRVEAAGQSYGVFGSFGSSSSGQTGTVVGLGGAFADSSGVDFDQALGVWLAQA